MVKQQPQPQPQQQLCPLAVCLPLPDVRKTGSDPSPHPLLPRPLVEPGGCYINTPFERNNTSTVWMRIRYLNMGNST